MQLEELADRLALRQVVEQYARGADTRDAVLYADAFTDDGVLVTNRGVEIRGREQMLTVAPRLGRYRATMHFVGNHYVDFDPADPDRATGQAYCIARHVSDAEEPPRDYVMHIVYHDEYRRTAAGWRIANRRLELLWDEEHPLRTV